MTAQISESGARVLCYLLPPASGALLLTSTRFSAVWSIRFHAIHSMLLSAVWVLAWSSLRWIEEICPWFFGSLISELRFGMNLCCLSGWALLAATAYQGERCAIIPWVHCWAVKLSRRSERWPVPDPGLAVRA
jgi:uncharacterized membrane protein